MKLAFLILIISVVKSENLQNGTICETFDSFEGVCVNINRCKILGDQMRSGSISFNQVKVCNDVTRFVCCPTQSSNVRANSNIPSSRDLNEFLSESCGKSVIGFGTVFYGTQIKRGAYPWLAALIQIQTDRFFCGGSLVSKNYVVTAAHCIEGKQGTHKFRPKDISVILGGHNLEARNEPGRITASVIDIYVHHEWNPNVVSYDADIAIVKLAEPISFSSFIQPICIAAPKSEPATKTEGVVVGFGRSEHKRVENIARVIKSPIHSYQVCANSSNHENLLTHRTFCGGFPNGTNVCEGDSGSGLIVKHDGIYYLRGIVSASLYDALIGCNINSYSIFTDVLEFYSWVTSGKDDKIMLQTVLEENRKLMLNITRCQQSSANLEILFQNLKEENQRLKDLTTTETSVFSLSNDLLTFQPKSAKFSKALCKNINNKPIEPEIFTGNQPVEVGEFPFHVALGYWSNYRNKNDYKCSGSLIADNIILTAAQCVDRYDTRPLTVKLGRASILQNKNDYGKGENIEIESIIRHPEYSRRSFQHDIALIKLKQPTNFTWPIQTACLSSSDENLPLNLTFPSFGRIDPDTNQLSDWLMKVTNYVYPYEQCQNIIQPHGKHLITKQFCSMTYNGLICTGSSGGALSYKIEKGHYIYGIMSYGFSCGFSYPSVCTKINQYLEWIDAEMYKFEKN